MRTVSEKYANISKYYMKDNDLFSTETITYTLPIGFRLFAIVQLPLKIFGVRGPWVHRCMTFDLTSVGSPGARTRRASAGHPSRIGTGPSCDPRT